MFVFRIIQIRNPYWNIFISEIPQYCQWETFKAKCPAGSVVVMQTVLYGRMQYGRCIEKDFGFVGCSNNTLSIADARCSGKRDCQIAIPDKQMDKISICPKDLTRYLEATYDCLPGIVFLPWTSRSIIKCVLLAEAQYQRQRSAFSSKFFKSVWARTRSSSIRTRRRVSPWVTTIGDTSRARCLLINPLSVWCN